ncbi:MAG: glutaredoxin 3 [Nitrospirae bacterium]|nr:glutaredoxin 3 [Nitrospirota bacterium]
MAQIVLYTKSYCPYSKNCKIFLEEKNVDYSEKIVEDDPTLEKEMETKSGGRTDTPQVFINDHHIGTFDDLKALDSQGELDKMLDL